MNGREDDFRRALQTLEKGVNYRVRVSAEDDHFITYLDGHLIGHSSEKLQRGGVGFFVDDQDPQQVAWVSVSERDSFLGRMLAHFSLFVVPGSTLPYRWECAAPGVRLPGPMSRSSPPQPARKMK